MFFGKALGCGRRARRDNPENGIAVTWFLSDGTVATMSAYEVYEEARKFDGITAPENAVAVNIPMWNGSSANEVYNLSLPTSYGHFYASHLQQIPANATRETETRLGKNEI